MHFLLSIRRHRITPMWIGPSSRQPGSSPRACPPGAHSHDRAQFVIAIRGMMVATTEIGTWALPPGYALWLPPGVVHDGAMLGAVSMRTAYLRCKNQIGCRRPAASCARRLCYRRRSLPWRRNRRPTTWRAAARGAAPDRGSRFTPRHRWVGRRRRGQPSHTDTSVPSADRTRPHGRL
jgi:AraC-like ligand binding domain